MISSPLALAAVIAGVTWLGFFLERRVPALSRVGASLLILAMGAIISNAGLAPVKSPVYDAVVGPVTSLAIVWLLLSVHLGDLRRAGGRMLGAFALSCLGTLVGAAVATFVLATTFGDETWRLAGAFVGTYTGGSVNFVAVGRGLEIPGTLFAGANAADALTTGIWMGACLLLPIWLRRWYPTPVLEEETQGQAQGQAQTQTQTQTQAQTQAGDDRARVAAGAAGGAGLAEIGGGASAAVVAEAAAAGEAEAAPERHPFFETAPVSVLSLSFLLALGLVLLVAAGWLGDRVPAVPAVLWLTTLALIVGHIPGLTRMQGASQLGNLALNLFFVVIGIFSRVADILAVGVAVFFFTAITVAIHGLITFGIGKLAKLDLGSLSVASQAAVGGPSSALAVAVARDWPALVLPGIIVGLLGYAVGNYLGFGAAYALRGLLH